MALWILDAGHGGEDFGVVGNSGRKEADITLDAVLEAKKHLERNGEQVILTRNCDENITMEDRVKIANDSNGKFFVSFHMNDDIDKSTIGVKVISITESSENDRLARLIKDEILSGTRTLDKGIEKSISNEYKGLNVIGVKIVGEYLSNEEVEKNFNSKKYGELVAKACLAMIDKVLLLTPITEPKFMQKKGWRVCIGYYKTYDEAEEIIRKLKKEGNKSAFIVPYDGK